MTEWFASSAALTAFLIGLRRLLRGRISPRLQYCLWLAALLRLLLPFSIGHTAFSAANLLPRTEGRAAPVIFTDTAAEPQPASAEDAASGSASAAAPIAPDTPERTPTQNMDRILLSIWLGGAAITGGWFLLCNLRCGKRLRRGVSRGLPASPGRPSVRISETAASACLFGLFRPVIYLTPACAADEQLLQHCAEHEYTHYLHRDYIWAALRGVCLMLHWFDPLVWWAAMLSRTDAELFCDEQTVRRLGEAARADYGRSLIRMTCRERSHPLCTATTMSGRGGQLKTRIVSLTTKPRTTAPTLLFALLLTLTATACAMTGAKAARSGPVLPPAISEAEAAPEAQPVLFSSARDAAVLAVPERYAPEIAVDDGFVIHADVTDIDYDYAQQEVLFSFYDKSQADPAISNRLGLVWSIIRYPADTAQSIAKDECQDLCVLLNNHILGLTEDSVYVLFCTSPRHEGRQYGGTPDAISSFARHAEDGIEILKDFIRRNDLASFEGAVDWEVWYREHILAAVGEALSGA